MLTHALVHYSQVAEEVLRSNNHSQLLARIGSEQFLYHVSTVFYAPGALLGLDVEIEVGKTAPVLQAAMRSLNISQLIGFTPQFPVSNPHATVEENQRLVRQASEKLKNQNIRHIAAFGRALDFPNGGDGCFILVDVEIDQMKDVLSDQFSCLCLKSEGVGTLVSLVDVGRGNGY